MSNMHEIEKMQRLVGPSEKDNLRLHAGINALYRRVDLFVIDYQRRFGSRTAIDPEDWTSSMLPDPVKNLLTLEYAVRPAELTLWVYADMQGAFRENRRVGVSLLRNDIPWVDVSVNVWKQKGAVHRELAIGVESAPASHWTLIAAEQAAEDVRLAYAGPEYQQVADRLAAAEKIFRFVGEKAIVAWTKAR